MSNELISWYLLNKRDLPWRNSTNPYHIWLSEIILQQTRVQQGMPYYLAFTEKFPTVNDLAEASEDEVLKLWQGLGYYSRARNLHYTAKHITTNLNGIFPSNYKGLLALKGIGDYTASAIASFAFNEAVAVLDGNVFRVISRLFNVENDIALASNRAVFKTYAQNFLDKKNPAKHNQAIMELGATICTPAPNCMFCPLISSCKAFEMNKVRQLPVKSQRVKVKTIHFHYLVLLFENQVFIKQRKENDIWKGLHDFILFQSEDESTLPSWQLGSEKFLSSNLVFECNHKLTHRNLEVHFYVEELSNKPTEPSSGFWIAKEEIFQLAVPKVIDNFLHRYFY